MGYNYDVLNVDIASDMKKKYNNSLAWRCYARRSIRNPFYAHIYIKNIGGCVNSVEKN